MKDPRQRLSWPELLSHPFIAGQVTGEYQLFFQCWLGLFPPPTAWRLGGPPCPAVFTTPVFASLLSAFSKD